MRVAILRVVVAVTPFVAACEADRLTPSPENVRRPETQHLASLTLDTTQAFTQPPTGDELALRDSLLAVLPIESRLIVEEILQRRLKNVVIGFSEPNGRAIDLYRRLVYAQIAGTHLPVGQDSHTVKVTLAIPTGAPRTKSELLRTGYAERPNIILLSPGDAAGPNLAGVLEAFKAAYRSTSNDGEQGKYATLDGAVHAAGVAGARAQRASYLATRLSGAPVTELPPIGSVRLLDIRLPAPWLTAQLKPQR